MPDNFDHIVLARKPMPFDRRDYRLATFITPEQRLRALTLTQIEWAVPRILDQGSTPHCVGYAWAGQGIAYPIADQWDENDGERIYYAAKVIDGEPNQENGSTTRSGVQAFMQFTTVKDNAYAFAYNLDDIVVWVLTQGPIITGTDWYYSMFKPDSDGLVHVEGSVAGGHEWMINGVDTVAQQFLCVNSWGTSYGKGGHFKIGFEDYAKLFDAQGDACTTLEIQMVPPTPVPTPPPPAPPPTFWQKLWCWIKKLFGGSC